MNAVWGQTYTYIGTLYADRCEFSLLHNFIHLEGTIELNVLCILISLDLLRLVNFEHFNVQQDLADLVLVIKFMKLGQAVGLY